MRLLRQGNILQDCGANKVCFYNIKQPRFFGAVSIMSVVVCYPVSIAFYHKYIFLHFTYLAFPVKAF